MLDPISKSPGGKAEIPVSINFIDMPDLIVVKVKSIFEFLETVFNPPAEQIVCNNHFGRRVEFVGNKDVVAIVVVLIPLAQNDNKHEDVSVGLYFRVKDLTCFVNMGKKSCSGIPRVEDSAGEINRFGIGVEEF